MIFLSPIAIPENLDYALYFNLLFFGIIALAAFFGFVQGFKRSLWGLIFKIIFVIIFFLTINSASNFIYNADISSILAMIPESMFDFGGASSINDVVISQISAALEVEPEMISGNEDILALVVSLSLFVIKIIYTILYFTVFAVIYKFITFILRLFIIKRKKGKSKLRLLGIIPGSLRGVVSVFLMLIIFGGLFDIIGGVSSIASILAEEQEEPATLNLSQTGNRSLHLSPRTSVIQLEESTGEPDISGMLQTIDDLILGYKSNVLTSFASKIQVIDEETEKKTAFNLFLFDKVLSVDYKDSSIAIRDEIVILSDAANIYFDSTFYETEDYADIEASEIRGIFTALSNSNLITLIIPLGIEVFSDQVETEFPIPVDELYEINWKTELAQTGEILATAFDIADASNLLIEGTDLDQVVLDGDDIKDLFDDIAGSQLANLGIVIAVDYLVSNTEGEISAIITVPDDIVWSDEISAFGSLAQEIFNTNVSIGTLQSGDPVLLLTALSEVDFTVIMESRIITQGLINILSGQADIGMDLNFLVMPDDIVWEDELESILLAVGALAGNVANLDFNDFQLDQIGEIDVEDINTIFESRIMIASLTKQIEELDLGEYSLIIPDSVYDEDGYILKTEFQNIIEGIHTLASQLTCDDGDEECAAAGFDLNKISLLEESHIDTIVLSEILVATIGNIVVDLGEEALTIPSNALENIFVDGISTLTISKTELKNTLLAISALGITDFQNMEMTTELFSNLKDESTSQLDLTKANTILDSNIIHATISKYLVEFGEGAEAVLIVPHLSESEVSLRYMDSHSTIEFVEKDEIINLLAAVVAIDIQDFENVDNLDLGLIAENGDIITDSSILQATISDQLLDLDTDGTINIPEYAYDGTTLIKKTVGTAPNQTQYITKAELMSAFDALAALNITDAENFDGNIDISLLADDTDRLTVLSSAIIQATISEIILDLETDEILNVPYVPADYDSQNPIFIRKTVGTVEYISVSELDAIILALNILNITDVETFDGNIDLSVLAVDDNGQKVLESSVIHATISDELIKLDTDGTLSLPYLAEDGVTEIRKTVGEVGKETEYVLSTELENVFIALDRLNITDIETFDGVVDISLLADETNRTDVLSSTIIQATISEIIIDLETDETLVVPYVPEDYDSQSPIAIRKTVGTTEYITNTELSSIIVALNILDITDIETFDGDIDLSVLAVDDNGEKVLESSVIHATISDELIKLDTDGTLSLPYLAEDGVTEIRKTVGEVGKETEYVLSTELENVFIALDRLDITDIETFTGTVDLSLLADDTKRAEVLSSVIIQATISKEVIDLETSGTLVVPYVPKDYDSQSPVSIRKTVGNTEYITTTELSSIIVALNILNITDIETFNGDIDLSILAVGDNGERVLESSVIHATVSDQIIVLDNDGKVVLPDLAIDGVTQIRNTVGEVGKETEYVLSTELENIFVALDRLNITDIETFTGTVDLSILADDTKRAEVLNSVIIQATISKEVIDLETSGTLVVPYAPKDYDSQSPVSIRKTVGSTEYITTTELSSIIVALNILNITDIETFNGDIDLSILAVGNNGQTVLESSVIHATISDKLVGLDNDDKVVLPYYDENNTTLIRFTVGEVGKETEYVLSTELENVFIALDRLNITDIESFTGSVDLSILADDTKRGEVISSVIIQATISETIIDLDTNLTIVAPYFSESEVLLRKLADNGPVSTEYISVSEIDKLIIAMNILNITDLDTFNGDIDLGILAVGNNGQRVLESSVIHATISDKLVGLDNADKVTLPYYAEDNLMQIRNTVGEVGKETEYVLSTELENIFVALNILNITDIESFTGSVDLSLLEAETNRTDVLSSVIIQATISETIIDLDTNLTIVAPHFSESEILLRKIADNGPVSTEFISVSEIDKLIIAMNILNITDLDTFNGDIDLSILAVGDNATDVIASDIIQATMSREVISLNDASTINAPYYQDDDTTLVRLSVGELQTETEYVKKLELEALVIALDILGITNIEDFTGSIDLSKFYSLENRNILLMSSIMQATISEQVINLGTSIIVVPTYNELGVETRRLVGTVGKTTDYILKQEIHDLFEALELFAITDINDFTGTITLDQFFESLDPEYDQNQQILLASASMHRTITKQISDLGNSVLAVPTYSITNTRVDFTVLATDYYIEKIEIKALFKALDILSINDITSFNGTVDLTPLFDIPANPNYSDNQDDLLASSLMHKTITNQIKNLGDTVLKVPEIGFDGVTTIDQVVQSNYYIEKFEIKFLIDALNILGISDITGFDGTIDLTRLSAGTDQDRILYSASIHATISMNLFDLDDQVLIVPIYSSLGEIESYRVQKQVNSVDFIYQEEIKDLINAFTDMGYSDLSSFGSEINSQKFFDNPNLYLLSASIHATLSDKLINGTGGELVVPDKDILNNTIRIIHSDVVYVEMSETKLLLTALEEIGLTNFSNIAISPTNLFDANTDISVLLASVSMQATISDTLLVGAGDDTTAYGTSTLIIPNYFRETIYVNLVATEQVEKTELEKLIIALKTVGVPDFTGSVPASEITNITDEDLDLKVLASGSMHVTINHMIWGNGNVNTLIPDEREGLALTDLLYNMDNIIIKDEVLDFIIAVKTTSSGSSITNVSFNYTTIASLSEPDRNTVLESLIVQNIMTDQLSVLWNADPFYEPAASDYHDSNTSYFLTDDGIRSVMIHYSII